MKLLEGLRALCSVSDHRGSHSVAQERFHGPSGLAEALRVYQRSAELAALAPDIIQTKQYLDSMTFGRDQQEFLLERDAVAARVDLEGLMDNPSLWSSIGERFHCLRGQYARAYAAHHARYHREAAELNRRLEAVSPQVAALARFNEMPELGELVGGEVSQLLEELRSFLRTCPVGDGEPSLDTRPDCRACGLPMSEEVPHQKATLLFVATEQAMREYNRRLGSHAVRRVLAHPTREQLDKFVNLVQVADPSKLANVLDDEVVDFLRRFLRRG